MGFTEMMMVGRLEPAAQCRFRRTEQWYSLALSLNNMMPDLRRFYQDMDMRYI